MEQTIRPGTNREDASRPRGDGSWATEAHSLSGIDSSGAPVRIGQNADQDRYTETTVDSAAVYDAALDGEQLAAGFDEPPESAVLGYDLDGFEEADDENYGPGFATRSIYRIFGPGEIALDVEDGPDTIDVEFPHARRSGPSPAPRSLAPGVGRLTGPVTFRRADTEQAEVGVWTARPVVHPGPGRAPSTPCGYLRMP